MNRQNHLHTHIKACTGTAIDINDKNNNKNKISILFDQTDEDARWKGKCKRRGVSEPYVKEKLIL